MTFLPLLLGAGNLISGLAQGVTNGGSTLGTLGGGFGPLGGLGSGSFGSGNYGGQNGGGGGGFGSGNNGSPGNGAGPSNPPGGSTPGQGSSPSQSLPYTAAPNPDDVPNTGAIRKYDWNIARGCLAPDGVRKCGMYINGQFPGPTLEANWGDTIQVTIHNNITGPEEGTSFHWHGLLQKETPWFDGVPSVSQCPIAPGSTFTYSFRADSVGTSWYHAHYSAQYTDGLFGPMVIYGPSHVAYDIDVGPVILSDYFHSTYYQNVEASVGKQFTPNSDNNLINGKMFFDCAQANGAQCTPNAGVSKFRFRSGAKHRLRLVNTGAEGLQRFRIDGHQMWVIANDFVPVKPYLATQVTLSVGQRTDIIVEGTGRPNDAAWMRSDISRACSFTSQPYALAAIYYENADTSSTPQTVGAAVNDTSCTNDALTLTEPAFPMAPPPQPEVTTRIDMEFGPNGTGALVWTMNNVSFRANYNNPVLLLEKLGNTTYPQQHPEWNIYNYGSAKSIRLHLTSIAPLPHPMHLHGQSNFWVVAEGQGQWDGTVTRPQNPQRRDTHIMNRGNPALGPAGESYLVLEFLADNPGVWPMHCHTAWHLSNGMYINVVERPDLIQQDMQIPDIMAETCRNWWTFSGSNVVDQIDAGV